MFHVVLHRPEIPPNTGNVIRLCANSGCELHLVAPLGFELDDARLRRAGLDYHEYADLEVHADLQAYRARAPQRRLFAFTTRAVRRHDHVAWQPGDALLFGSESSGLPADVLASIPEAHQVRLPMRPDMRSINLSNAVAIAVYEAWRQQDFAGAGQQGPAAR
ncbi:MAG TPA: tRNA (cytidine(34)-2'-O)-methyltransferase [Pseudomonadales bacterium]|nr:tRNA (cytidine(34)-2'-O)-methyltransferase [Pseudomonadales bacterium]